MPTPKLDWEAFWLRILETGEPVAKVCKEFKVDVTAAYSNLRKNPELQKRRDAQMALKYPTRVKYADPELLVEARQNQLAKQITTIMDSSKHIVLEHIDDNVWTEEEKAALRAAKNIVLDL